MEEFKCIKNKQNNKGFTEGKIYGVNIHGKLLDDDGGVRAAPDWYDMVTGLGFVAVKNEIKRTFQKEVHEVLMELETLLVSKNEKYGNSALEPKRIFSNANPVEQIKVRIDDKLSRMSAGTSDNEDTVQDLMGYLVLLKIAEKKPNF